MPTHDIIDNRDQRLVDHINRILGSTERARFAVGYFFLSGLTSIAKKLTGVKDLRLLIGNTTNREALEQLTEGYRRLELVKEAAEAQAFSYRSRAVSWTDFSNGSPSNGGALLAVPSFLHSILPVGATRRGRPSWPISRRGRIHPALFGVSF